MSLLIFSSIAQNNIGINNPTPDPSAALDIKSDTMGLLFPRVADTSAVNNPAEGLMVYDLASHCMRYFNGTKWSECMGFPNAGNSWNCGDVLIDERDGANYGTVQIGTQCWMAENMNIGTMINGSNDQTNNSNFEKYCYGDNTSNCDVYGGLYQWDEMMQYGVNEGLQGICPSGWHIPTDAEWCTMENEVDAGAVSCSATDFRGLDAGGNLKETGTLHWGSPNSGATNSSGFTGLPGGFRSSTNGAFYNLSDIAYFWTSSEIGGTAWHRRLTNSSPMVQRNDFYQPHGASVRCLKD